MDLQIITMRLRDERHRGLRRRILNISGVPVITPHLELSQRQATCTMS